MMPRSFNTHLIAIIHKVHSQMLKAKRGLLRHDITGKVIQNILEKQILLIVRTRK